METGASLTDDISDPLRDYILPRASGGQLRDLIWLRLVCRRWRALIVSLERLKTSYYVLYSSMDALTGLQSLAFVLPQFSRSDRVSDKAISLSSLTNLTALEYNRKHCPRLLDLTTLTQLRSLALDHVRDNEIDLTSLPAQLTSLSLLADGPIWALRCPHSITTLRQLHF